jgi:copper chaperone CopZ
MTVKRFKTNIRCGGCVAAVTPHLNEVQGLAAWSVDTDSPDKVLTTDLDDAAAEAKLHEALARAGYKAEALAE